MSITLTNQLKSKEYLARYSHTIDKNCNVLIVDRILNGKYFDLLSFIEHALATWTSMFDEGKCTDINPQEFIEQRKIFELVRDNFLNRVMPHEIPDMTEEIFMTKIIDFFDARRDFVGDSPYSPSRPNSVRDLTLVNNGELYRSFGFQFMSSKNDTVNLYVSDEGFGPMLRANMIYVHSMAL